MRNRREEERERGSSFVLPSQEERSQHAFIKEESQEEGMVPFYE